MSAILFFLEIILAWAVIFAVQIPVRKIDSRLLHAAVLIIKLLLIPVLALAFIAMEWKITYKYGFLFNAAYIALIGDSFAGVIEFVIGCIRKSLEGGNKHSGTETDSSKETNSDNAASCDEKKHSNESRHRRDQRLIAVIGIVSCIVLTTYGFINSQRYIMKTHVWQADGLTKEHTFAFLADLHTGTAQPVDSLHELCRQINEADPEFVVFGGDVTDELTSYEDMVSTYEILSEIKAPTYFVYGNHDRQPNADYYNGRTYSDEQLSEAIQGAGITILKDEYAAVSDDLMLLGREDMSMGDQRKDWSELSGTDLGGCALIVADHEPYDNDQLEQEKAALQLSGHTHAGQLWPIQIIYRLLRLQAYGEFEYPDTLLYVSSGASGWMTPFRTEEHCEWELVTLKP